MNQQNQLAGPCEQSSRSRFQFGMRTLLVFIFVVGCAMGWVAFERRKNARYQAAVAIVHHLGGHTPVVGNLPKSPRWLQSLLGKDSSRPVLGVWLSKSLLSDSDLKHLQGISKLQSLWLVQTNINDRQLEFLKEFSELEDLWLCDNQITDAGLYYLKDLKRLELLNVSGTQVTDRGLKHLDALTNLKCLVVDDRLVDRPGLSSFKYVHPKCIVKVKTRREWESEFSQLRWLLIGH